LVFTVIIHRFAQNEHQSWAYILWKMSAVICILMGIGIQFIFSLNYIKYHLSEETRDTFYSRNIGYYNVVQWINKNLSSSHRIANPIRYLNYLFDVPYFYISSSQVLIDTLSTSDIKELFQQIYKQRITHIIVRPKIIQWKSERNDLAAKLINNNLFYDLHSFDVRILHSKTLGITNNGTAGIIQVIIN